MTLHGWPAATLLGMLGAAGAALVALYLLRQRRRRVEVSFLRLWTADRRQKTLRSLRRLRWPLSLLLQLLLLALLVAALGDPRGEGRGGRSLVILLDASASMTATDVLPSRMERARAEAHRVLSTLSGSDRAMIVRLDARPRALGPFDSDPVALGRLIDAVQPSHTAADLGRALALARDALLDRPRPAVVLVGDGAWPDEAIRTADLGRAALHTIRVGASGENVGIVAFSARPYPQDRRSYEAYAEVQSFASRPVTARLTVIPDGGVQKTRELRLDAGAAARLTYPDLQSAGGQIEARLQTDPGVDRFALDDRAIALLPDARRKKALLVSDGNLFLEGALLLSETVDVERIAPGDYRAVPAGRYDVVVLDRVTPDELPRARGLLYLAPLGAGAPVAVGEALFAPFLEGAARRHPLVRDIVWKDVNVAQAHSLVPAAGDTVLAHSFGAPLIVAGTRGEARFLALGFDLRKSDLVMRVAFPLLLRNALDWFSGDAGESPLALPAGRSARVPVHGAGPVDVRGPDGARGRAAVLDGAVTLWPDRVGLWRVGDGEVAVNLTDADESRIAPRPIARGAALPQGPLAPRGRPWSTLVLLAALLILVEWATYHRRVTV